MSIFSVSIGKEQLCFTAAHFIAFKGFREPLHGHTYQAEVKVSGPVGPDGYVVDFLVLKKIAEEECQQLHFTTLLPEHSDCLRISADAETVRVECEDGTQFSFPPAGCPPAAHRTLLIGRDCPVSDYATARARLAEARGNSIETIEVLIEDIPGQVAVCREPFRV